MKNRHEEIINILSNEGSVTVSYLSKVLDVSEVTIRKDLNQLEEMNKLYRSHGKAKLITSTSFSQNSNLKDRLNIFEKSLIAMEAIKTVDDRDSIMIASGTTVTAFAKELAKTEDHLTIMSASSHATTLLCENKNLTVIQIGGTIRHSTSSVVGPNAERMVNNFSCNKLYIGVDSIDLDYGLATTNGMEASLNIEMMKASHKVIVLADSTKFGKRGFSKICNINNIHMVITDSGIPEAICDKLKDMDIEVVIATSNSAYTK